MSWFADHFFQKYHEQVMILTIVIPNVIELVVLGLVLLFNRATIKEINVIKGVKDLFLYSVRSVKRGFFTLKYANLILALLLIEIAVLTFSLYYYPLAITVTCVLIASMSALLYYIPSINLTSNNDDYIQKTEVFNPHPMVVTTITSINSESHDDMFVGKWGRFKSLIKKKFSGVSIKLSRFNNKFIPIRNCVATVLLITVIGSMILTANTWDDQFRELLSGTSWPHLDGNISTIAVEYYMLGFTHLFQFSIRLDFDNLKRIPHALFHLGAGILTFYLETTERNTRFHHDFLGILLMLIPLRGFQLVGILYVVDAICYKYAPDRQGGFDNTVVNNFSIMLPIILLAGLIELITKYIIFLIRTHKPRPQFYSPIDEDKF